jgi:hypothetical protein
MAGHGLERAFLQETTATMSPMGLPLTMAHWHNISDIANAFDFSPSATLDEARAELLKRLAKIHPDQNSGSFLSADTEAQYYKTWSAIQKIDELKLKGSNLVPYAEKPVAAWKSAQANERTEEASLSRVYPIQ